MNGWITFFSPSHKKLRFWDSHIRRLILNAVLNKIIMSIINVSNKLQPAVCIFTCLRISENKLDSKHLAHNLMKGIDIETRTFNLLPRQFSMQTSIWSSSGKRFKAKKKYATGYIVSKKALKWLLEPLGMVTQEEWRISQAPVVGSLL